ncbi:flagellar basal body-associated FliL family protein [Paenibacillus tundrae]|uniref:Flagellar protein FliL n=1 Tax=Paenibacillus tundrae TaxID=528187 RepID=A0ABT9W9K5_9BACL|nr:flagellar basal body-associated FliL family protein [Paenibacillus tundrae]MDQ0169938.1 flagellar FliL protein [Paenibacillus tundrae]
MKKMMPWIAMSLLAITLIAVVVFVFMQTQNGNNADAHKSAAVVEKKKTADEIVEVTSEITDIKTNLADTNHILQAKLSFELADAKSKEEFEKIKEITVKPIIIQTLADTQPEELKTAKGRSDFNIKLTELINTALPEPKLSSTSFTDFLMVPM